MFAKDLSDRPIALHTKCAILLSKETRTVVQVSVVAHGPLVYHMQLHLGFSVCNLGPPHHILFYYYIFKIFHNIIKIKYGKIVELQSVDINHVNRSLML